MRRPLAPDPQDVRTVSDLFKEKFSTVIEEVLRQRSEAGAPIMGSYIGLLDFMAAELACGGAVLVKNGLEEVALTQKTIKWFDELFRAYLSKYMEDEPDKPGENLH